MRHQPVEKMKKILIINFFRALFLCIIVNFIYPFFISNHPFSGLTSYNNSRAIYGYLIQPLLNTLFIFYVIYLPLGLISQEIYIRFRRYKLLWHFILCILYVFILNNVFSYFGIRGSDNPDRIFNDMYVLIIINEIIIHFIFRKSITYLSVPHQPKQNQKLT